LEQILEREKGATTTLDTGLAIPHARTDLISDFHVALGLVPEGFQDASQPGITIKAVFLFLSPKNPQFFQKHLKLLSALSALFQPQFIEKLIAMSSSQQVIDAIKSAE